MNHDFFQSVDKDFADVDQLIGQSLTSAIPLVEQIATYLIAAGGKRLRPLLVLLCAKACGYEGREHIKLAAVIEFLHTAMLLHDDVVDASDLRRGRKTVNAEWGNPASVLVGDFLHSRAFEMMVDIGDLRIMKILSHATNTIAEGEVQQLANLRNLGLTEKTYLQVISRKTAMLFQAAAHAGAVLGRANSPTETALRDYGFHLGLAFQLIFLISPIWLILFSVFLVFLLTFFLLLIFVCLLTFFLAEIVFQFLFFFFFLFLSFLVLLISFFQLL